MQEKLSLEVTPRTIMGRDFLAVLTTENFELGSFLAEHAIISNPAIRTSAGEIVVVPESSPATDD